MASEVLESYYIYSKGASSFNVPRYNKHKYDLIITAGTTDQAKFYIHRAVFCFHCPIQLDERLVRNNFTFSLKKVRPKIFEKIIQFIYYGETKVLLEDYEEFELTAGKLQMGDVRLCKGSLIKTFKESYLMELQQEFVASLQVPESYSNNFASSNVSVLPVPGISNFYSSNTMISSDVIAPNSSTVSSLESGDNLPTVFDRNAFSFTPRFSDVETPSLSGPSTLNSHIPSSLKNCSMTPIYSLENSSITSKHSADKTSCFPSMSTSTLSTTTMTSDQLKTNPTQISSDQHGLMNLSGHMDKTTEDKINHSASYSDNQVTPSNSQLSLLENKENLPVVEPEMGMDDSLNKDAEMTMTLSNGQNVSRRILMKTYKIPESNLNQSLSHIKSKNLSNSQSSLLDNIENLPKRINSKEPTIITIE